MSALLIHQALALRHLCGADGDDAEAFASIDSGEGFGLLVWRVLPSDQGLKAQELVPHHVSDEAVRAVVRAIADLNWNELAEVSDTVLRRLNAGLGRGGGEAGAVDSRVAKLLTRGTSIVGSPSTIYDPACGIAQTLVELAERHKNVQRIVGVEANAATATVARVRFLLRDLIAEIHTADSLQSEPVPELLADVIVAEPPFFAKDKTQDLHWVHHVANHLAADGIGLVLTRASVLKNVGGTSARRALVESGALQAVIALGGKVVQYASTPLALWMLRAPSTDRHLVTFVDGSRQSSPEDWAYDWVDEIDLDNEVQGAPSVRIKAAELIQGATPLLPSKWVASAARRPSEVRARLKHAAESFEDAPLPAIPDVLDLKLPMTPSGVKTIDELEREGVISLRVGTVPTSEETPESAITFGDLQRMSTGQALYGTGLSWELPTAAEGDLTQVNDVVVALRATGEAAVDLTGGHLLTKDLFRVRINTEQIDPLYLALCMRRGWVDTASDAPGSLSALREFEIPMLPSNEQATWVERIQQLERIASDARILASATENLREALLESLRYGRTSTDV